jgi:carboxymethylenebutenolidase
MINLLLLSLAFGGQQSCCDMAQFAADPAFVAKHLAPKPFRFQATTGRMVTFAATAGKPGSGFYVPPRKGAKAAVIMIHEWWGLNDHIKREAERLNKDTGYAVLAVDLYEGTVAKTPAEAGRAMQSVNEARATSVVAGAVRDLKRGDLGFKASKLGTIGYCFGGGWSHRTAIEGGKNVNACVIYYGMPDMAPARLARLQAPVLMVYGTQDKWINKDVAEKFRAAMQKAGKSIVVKPYNADHAFANPSNPKFDAKAGEDARRQTLAFYRKHLGS